MSLDLFQLLPAVYRMRDAQIAQSMQLLTPAQLAELAQLQALPQPLPVNQQAQLAELQALASRGPLQSLLMLIGEQLEAVAYDINQLYDDQFIETCAPWVIPYIGDLIGYQSIKNIAPAVDAPRAEVAQTISLRRRKGTILVIEQLARDVTGWGAHAVEEFQVLADTQYLKHLRHRNHYAPNLRQWQNGVYMDTAFNATAHKVDVHLIGSGGGQYNIQNVAIFLWSLSAASITNALLTSAKTSPAGQLCYRFNALGLDQPLFHRALSQGEQITTAAGPANVPDSLLRRVLCADLAQGVGASFYGQGASLAIYLDQKLLSPYQIAVADLSGADGGWNNLPPATSPYTVVVDPQLGRLALPSGEAGHDVSASWFYGVNANLGGGDYSRGSNFAVQNEVFVVPFPNTDPALITLQDVLTYALALLPLNSAVAVEIFAQSAADLATDTAEGLEPYGSASHIIASPLAIDLPAGATFELRAADLTVQTLFLDSSLTVSGDQDSTFLLNGIVLAAQSSFVPSNANPALLNVPVARTNPSATDNLLSQLTITDCTLVPGWSYPAATGNPATQTPNQPDAPVLQIASPSVTVSIATSILGGIVSNALATIGLINSIVDATNPGSTAYAAVDGTSGGAALTLNGCTVVGRVHATLLTLVTHSILWSSMDKTVTSGLIADRKQAGCVRFSFLPFNAVTSPPYKCVQQASAGVQPYLVSTNYGQPGYLKLMACTDDSIRRGADDGGEMGAYHFLLAPQRESDLEIRVQEYLPVGLQFGLIYQN
jgi:hypothetical protein